MKTCRSINHLIPGLTLAIIASLSFSVCARAESIQITPSLDGFISQNPDLGGNQFDAPVLKAYHNPDWINSFILLAFPLEGFKNVENATLQVTALGVDPNTGTTTIHVYPSIVEWTKDAGWETFDGHTPWPANEHPLKLGNEETVWVQVSPGESPATYSLNVTDAVKSALQSGENVVRLIIRPGEVNGATIELASSRHKEKDFKPLLVVEQQ